MSECWHVIYHPATEEERQRVARGLEYSRAVGDTQGVIIATAQLTERCEYRDGPTPAA